MSVLALQKSESRKRVSWQFYSLWIGAHIVAFLLSIPLYELARSQLGLREAGPAAFFAFFACSLMLGILQGLILNSRLPRMWWERWALATGLTMLLVGALSVWL